METVFLFLLLLATTRAAPFSPDGTVVDLNNPDPEILRQHNINMSEFVSRQAAYRASKGVKSLPTAASSASSAEFASDQPYAATQNPVLSARNDSGLDIVAINRQLAQTYLELIKDKLLKNILRNDTAEGDQENFATHDIAVYPLCPNSNPVVDAFRANNISYNLFFNPPQVSERMRVYLSEATLRLFKMDSNNISSGSNESPETTTASNEECGWNSNYGDEMIRVTISAYVKKHRKYKKRTYCSIMVKKAYSGWIELDVKSMIGLWEKKNFGLAIDVHDQDENLLKASQYFYTHSCEASRAFPFAHFAERYFDICNKAVPRNPRIDYQYVQSYNTHQYRQKHHYNHFMDENSSTFAHNDYKHPDLESSHNRRGQHSHRQRHFASMQRYHHSRTTLPPLLSLASSEDLQRTS